MEFVGDLSTEEFTRDTKTAFAVIRALETIGEAAKHIPDHIRARSPGIPWRLITGMRDKLIHAYHGVDLKVVWRAIREDLPIVVDDVTQALQKLDDAADTHEAPAGQRTDEE